MQIPLPDNTQHLQQTDIHAPVGFKPAVADPRPRPRGRWDRFSIAILPVFYEGVCHHAGVSVSLCSVRGAVVSIMLAERKC
jgi:hypothetical protein